MTHESKALYASTYVQPCATGHRHIQDPVPLKESVGHRVLVVGFFLVSLISNRHLTE